MCHPGPYTHLRFFVSSPILAAWSGTFADWAQYDSAAGVTMLKSITPHLPSLPAWAICGEQICFVLLIINPIQVIQFVGFHHNFVEFTLYLVVLPHKGFLQNISNCVRQYLLQPLTRKSVQSGQRVSKLASDSSIRVMSSPPLLLPHHFIPLLCIIRLVPWVSSL